MGSGDRQTGAEVAQVAASPYFRMGLQKEPGDRPGSGASWR